MNCPCSPEREFSDCCQPFLEGKTKPKTAEELMRSRFSAYTVGAVEYLLRSTHPSTRKFYKEEDIEKWAKSNIWQKLEIIAIYAGEAKDKQGTVEFKAYFTDKNGKAQIHYELSNFRKELGKWFYVDGNFDFAPD